MKVIFMFFFLAETSHSLKLGYANRKGQVADGHNRGTLKMTYVTTTMDGGVYTVMHSLRRRT